MMGKLDPSAHFVETKHKAGRLLEDARWLFLSCGFAIFLAYMVTEAVGFICAGLVIALVLRNKAFVDTR